MIKPSEVNITDVTAEQIGRCHKVYQGREPVWMVESEQDALTEYKVRYDAKRGFTCTCKAGQQGFANCKAGVCKHVIWALAASHEEKEAVAELNRAIAEQAAPVTKLVTNVDSETLARVQAASEKPRKVSKAKAPESKPFSLLRV